jgi:tetratricopeptide (TPR) repeat protein
MAQHVDLEQDQHAAVDREFTSFLRMGYFDDARRLIARMAEEPDPDGPSWRVTSKLENLGLALAFHGRHDESIATFEELIAMGWTVVPDARCEIARVLLLASRHAEADELWRELRDADPGGVWTLNAGGLAYHEVGRDEEAVAWLGEGLRVALSRDDPEQVVDQMSDARRVSLRRLGRDLDGLEREVEAFRAELSDRELQRAEELRVAAKRAGLPVRGRSMTIAWLTEEEDRAARSRWPQWVDGVRADGPFDERRQRMELSLRERRADGDGPFVIVTIDCDRYSAWCEDHGHEPADRRSRGEFVDQEREAGGGRRWPPGRNEPCWCGSERKYKRCCGAVSAHAAAHAVQVAA